jgi:hypothetical protein
MDPFVIITVPHCQCDFSDSIRNCDRVARYSASLLFDKIPYERVIFFSDIPRAQIDLNRYPSRSTSFRRRISDLFFQLARDNRTSNVLLLDIHSFDENHFGPVELAILDEKPGNSSYVSRFHSCLIREGVVTSRFIGDHNDILQEARSYSIPSVLLEFNENLTPSRIDEITSIVVKCLDTLFES